MHALQRTILLIEKHRTFKEAKSCEIQRSTMQDLDDVSLGKLRRHLFHRMVHQTVSSTFVRRTIVET